MAQAQATINVALNTGQVAAQLRALQTQINAFSNSLNKGNVLQANEAKRFQQQLLDTVNTSRFFTAEIVKMRSAASTLDVTLSKGQATLGQYFSARFMKSSNAAAQVMSLANARAKALETQFIATSGAASGFREAIAIRPIAAFSDSITVNSQKLAIHRAMLRQATTSMINFGKNTQWAGRQLMVGFTVPLTIFGAAAGKTFRDIERQAVQFKKVYGDIFTPPEEMQQNLDAVMELSREFTKYGIALKDTLGLAAEAAAAGSRNAALTDAVTAATRLSTLGQMEQAQALETTIALQNAFQLQGEELADAINYLNMVENQTVVTLQDLAAAIPRVAPVVKGLGGDVRDLAAFMAAMQEGGVSAEQGANALKSGLASLINPTDKASEKLKEMGININAIIQTNRGDLMATVQAFSTALKTLDEFERQQALEQVFGKFQYARLGALFANITKEGSQAAQALDIARQSSEQLAASADKELSIIEESFGVKFTAAVERFKIALMPIGEMFTKLAIPLINFATKIAEAFNNLPDFAKNFIGLATVIGGIVVPAGTMFLGLIFNLIGTLTKFGHIVGVAFKGFFSGGISGAVTAVSQSLKYMSLQEIDAAVAAQQLGRSADFVNAALLKQVGAAESARAAVTELAGMYKVLAASMRESAAAMPATMFVAGAASGAARGAVKRNTGGTIPGFGQNKDTVPAMLTPGEFVVKREATADNLDLLHAINSGEIKQFNRGGHLTARRAAEMMGYSQRTLRRHAQYLGLPMAQGKYLVGAREIEQLKRSMQATKWQRTHTSTQRIMATSSSQIPGGSARSSFLKLLTNAGVPVELLDNAWIRTPFNQKLRAGGIMGSDIIREINKGADLFKLGPGFRGIDNRRLLDLIKTKIDPSVTYTDFGSGKSNFGALVRTAAKELNPGFNPRVTGGYVPSAGRSQEVVTGLSQRGYEVKIEKKGGEQFFVVSKNNKVIAREKMGASYFNTGGLVSGFNAGGIAKPFKFGPAIAKALYGKYPPMFTSAIPGTRMYGFGEGARQPAIGGAPGKPTTILNLIREASTDPKLAGRRQFRLMVNGEEIVVNRLGQRQIDRLGSGSYMRMPFETRPITKAKEKQFYNQWVAAKRPGKGSEYEAFGNWMLGKGYQRNRTTGEFFKPFRADVNEPILGEVLMPRSAMGRQQQEFPSWIQKFMAGGQVLRMQQVQKIISKLGPDQARRYFAGMQTNAADQKVINSALSRTAQRMSPAFRARQAMSVADMDKDFDSFKWSRLSGKYVLSENAVNHMLRSGQRVVYYPDLRSGELQNALNNNRFVVTKKNGRLVFNNQFGLETTLPKSADGKYNVFSPDEIFFANQGGMAFDSSRRNIVPGMGDKDTVPAVLTPGEFVINKDATKRNLDLLHAINSGKMSNMNKGGGVATKGREFYGQIDQDIRRMMIAFGRQGQRISAAEAALMIKAGVEIGDIRKGLFPQETAAPSKGMGGMGRMGISMGMGALGGALMMGSTAVSSPGMAGAMNVGGTALSMLSILPFLGKAAGPVAGIVAAGAAIVSVVAGMKTLANSVKELNGAMLGSTDRVNQMAQAFGRTTNVQQIALQRAQAAGGPIGEQALQAGGQFLQTTAGARLIKDLQLVRTAGENQVEALTKQLQRSILAGAITPEEARGIAIQVGQALGSQKIGVQASVAITSIFGPNGERLEDNRLQIASQIIPEISGEELDKIAPELAKQMGKIDFSKGFDIGAFGTSLLTLGGQVSIPFLEQEAKFKAIGNAAIEAAQIEKEQIASVVLARQQGTISLEQYRMQLEKILELDISGKGFEQAAQAFADISNMNLEDLQKIEIGSIQESIVDKANFVRVGLNKEQNAIINFYTEIESQFKNIATQQGQTQSQIQATIDLAQKLGGTKFEQAEILQSLSGGEFDPAFVNRLKELADNKILENILPPSLGDRAKQMKELSVQLETFSAIPGLQEKIFSISIAEKYDERGSNRGKSVAEIIKGYEDAYAAVERIPEEVRKVLNVDMGDPQQLLQYQNIAPELEKQYNRVANYIKNTNDDISKQDVQMRIVSYYAGEDADLAKSLIKMAGKSFDPVKLPLLIAMLMDPDTKALLENYDVLRKTPGQVVGEKDGKRQTFSSPEELRGLRTRAEPLLANVLYGAGTGETPDFDPDKKDGVGGAKSALQQLIEGYQVAIKFASIKEKLTKLGTPEQLIAELESMGAEGLKIANSLLQGKNKSLLELAKKADTLATTKMITDKINSLNDSIKNIRLKKSTFNELLGMGVSREDAKALIEDSEFLLAIEKAKPKEKEKLISRARQQLQIEKSLTQTLKTQSEIQLESLDKQINAKDERLNLLQLQEQEFRLINIQPIQDQINAIEKINRGIARSIELEQRKVEPIREAIEALEEEKTKIDERYDKEIESVNEAYDLRIEALEKAESINERIAQQQQNQIGLASALSRGDIVAAAQAMSQMQRDDAAARMEDAREALQAQKDAQLKELEIAREKEIDAIQSQINIKKAEQEAIERTIETLQKQQLANSDTIYNLNLSIEEQEKRIEGNLQAQLALELEILRIRKERASIVVAEAGGATTASGGSESRGTLEGGKVAYVDTKGNVIAEVPKKPNVTNAFIPGLGLVPMAVGGMVKYKGSREPAPGMAFGGMMKKYAYGSLVGGMGNTDRVPALLTPGEYVVNKASSKKFLPLLEAINGTKFPDLIGSKVAPSIGEVVFNVPKPFYTGIDEVNRNNVSVVDNSLKNNQYQINVNVAGSNSSADQIANAVIGKIRMIDKKQIQGVSR